VLGVPLWFRGERGARRCAVLFRLFKKRRGGRALKIKSTGFCRFAAAGTRVASKVKILTRWLTKIMAEGNYLSARCRRLTLHPATVALVAHHPCQKIDL
jgi:hypothetical protein